MSDATPTINPPHYKIDLSKYIEVRLFGERPHIRGRRIPVGDLVGWAESQGWGVAETAYQSRCLRTKCYQHSCFIKKIKP